MLPVLAKHTLHYGLSSILGRIIHYVLIPLYTSILSPKDYGIITEMYAYIAFLHVFYTFGIETTYFRFVTKYTQQKKKYCSHALYLIVIIGIFISILLVGCAEFLTKLWGYPGKAHYVYAIVIILFTDTLLVLPFAQLRLQKKSLIFAQKKFFFIALNLVLNFFFLIYAPAFFQQHSGDTFDYCAGILYANAWANGIMVCTFYRFFRHYIVWKISWSRIRAMLQYAWPICLTGLASTTNEMFSRAMMKYCLPNYYTVHDKATLLGIFGGCYKLSVFMLLCIQAFRYAAEPLFFSYAKHHKSPVFLSKVMHAFVLFTCLVLLFVSIHLPFLGKIFLRNSLYQEGLGIVPYLSLAYVFYGIYYNLSIWFKLQDQPIYGLYCLLIGACITVGGNFFLVPLYGYWGCVWAVLASYFTMMVVCYRLGKKRFHVPYKVFRGLCYVVGVTLFIMVYPYITFVNICQQLIWNFFFMLVYLMCVYFFEYKKFRRRTLFS